MRTSEPFIDSTIDALNRVRLTSPLVQCITNSVVVNFTANALLAIGAAPAMVDIVGEAGPFATIASGLLINLGTPTPEQRAAMIEAQAGAAAGATPWVLDPVAIGSLPVRTPLAHRLRELRPSVVRGNASEIIALSGTGVGGRGVDALDSVETALPAARSLAESTGGIVAVSGAVDLLTDGIRVVRIATGDPMLTRITGGGCALGAVMAAFLAADDDHLAATVAAVTVYTIAAELAAAQSAGPGTFGVAFLDALAAIDDEHIAARARIS